VLCLLFFFYLASAEVFFDEQFDGDWESRWVVSRKRTDGTQGQFDISAGQFYADAEKDKGLQTTQDARFYAISAEMIDFSNLDKKSDHPVFGETRAKNRLWWSLCEAFPCRI